MSCRDIVCFLRERARWVVMYTSQNPLWRLNPGSLGKRQPVVSWVLAFLSLEIAGLQDSFPIQGLTVV